MVCTQNQRTFQHFKYLQKKSLLRTSIRVRSKISTSHAREVPSRSAPDRSIFSVIVLLHGFVAYRIKCCCSVKAATSASIAFQDWKGTYSNDDLTFCWKSYPDRSSS